MKKFFTILLGLMCFAHMQAQESIISDGMERKMIVYVPKNLGDNRPLLISMHGMNQDANYQRNQAQYENVADTAKFVVVYPQGEGNGWDLGSMKDINFITNIINEMYKRHNIDRNRVYLSGFSMGGMMTYYAMTKIADKIAAFAPVSGYPMSGPNTASSRPVPIFHVHGTTDDTCTYGPVQSHIDAWVKRNGCSTTAKEEKPKTGPSNTSARIYRYQNGQGGVEVAHLKLPNKGHWHSNDPQVAMTNAEIWNFCKRFSLTPGPKFVSATPEDNSFDLDYDKVNTFTVTFDKPVDCANAKGTLLLGTKATAMKPAEKGESKTLTFTIPSYVKTTPAEYIIKVANIMSLDGGKGNNVTLHYTYGITEVQEEFVSETAWKSKDWRSQRESVGEGCPLGWTRINSKSDGSTNKTTSGQANTGGARLKYFPEGGDFDTGFYLSARDFEKVTFTYGNTSGYDLTLPAGKYMLNIPSIYWSQGAYDAKSTFSAALMKKDNNSVIVSEPTIAPTGCLKEKEDQKVQNSALLSVPFELTASTNCILEFTMTAGWNSVVLGEPYITTRPSVAQEYKGGFMHELATAKKMLEAVKDMQGHDVQIAALRSAIEKYEDFASTSPSEYKVAIEAMKKAMEPVIPLDVKSVDTIARPADNRIFDLTGRQIKGQPKHGLYIINGKAVSIK